MSLPSVLREIEMVEKPRARLYRSFKITGSNFYSFLARIRLNTRLFIRIRIFFPCVIIYLHIILKRNFFEISSMGSKVTFSYCTNTATSLDSSMSDTAFYSVFQNNCFPSDATVDFPKYLVWELRGVDFLIWSMWV